MEAGGTAFWLPTGDVAIAAVLHSPPRAPLATGVLLLPPFGWEETASHRAVRRWADQLAVEGHPVLRFDWPGTGDSSGDGTVPGQLAAWQATVAAGAGYLREHAGCARVAAVGLGLGGLVGLTKADEIDDFALWGTPTTGHAAVRQLRATASLLGSAGAEHDGDDTLWVFGYPLAASFRTELEQLEVAQLHLTRPGRRILVFDRGHDAPLVAALQASGCEVSVKPGEGYDDLVEHPQLSRLPERVVQHVSDWLGRQPAAESVRTAAPLPKETVLPGTAVRERTVELGSQTDGLRAVITEPVSAPASALTAVLLNSGATRRTGPNRMWVEAARRWAEQGLTVVRLDLALMGEGGGHQPSPRLDAAYFSPTLLEQVREALDDLARTGLADRFFLAGLCSGAYWSWQLAASDPRVVGAVLLNPKLLHFAEPVLAARASQDLRKLGTAGAWRRLVTGELSAKHVVRVAVASAGRVSRFVTYSVARRQTRDAENRALEQINASGARVAIVFAPEEEYLRELQAQGRLEQLARGPHVSLHLLKGPGNSHTLSPVGLRTQAHAIMDQVVAELRS